VDHDHARPETATMRAVLGVARAVLAADPERAVEAAAAVRCPVCLAVCATQFGFALCASLAGEPFVTGELHARLAAAITNAEAELRAAGN
jgi:hypothetical protein